VRRYLDRIGVRVPRLLLDASADGYLVIEDLTDRTLEQALKEGVSRRKVYSKAIDRSRGCARTRRRSGSDCIAWSRAFDYDLYHWEFEHFIEYGLLARGATPSGSGAADAAAAFRAHLARARRRGRAGSRTAITRAANIMVLADGEQVVIDFRDALQAATVRPGRSAADSYVELRSAAHRRDAGALLKAFERKAGSRWKRAYFVGFFDLLTVQRKLKDAGRIRVHRPVKKNPSFLAHIRARGRACGDSPPPRAGSGLRFRGVAHVTAGSWGCAPGTTGSSSPVD